MDVRCDPSKFAVAVDGALNAVRYTQYSAGAYPEPSRWAEYDKLARAQRHDMTGNAYRKMTAVPTALYSLKKVHALLQKAVMKALDELQPVSELAKRPDVDAPTITRLAEGVASASTQKVLQQARSLIQGSDTAQINIIFLGEQHHTEANEARYNTVVRECRPSLVVLEQALTYDVPEGLHVVREEEWTTVHASGVDPRRIIGGLNIRQRSEIAAAYLCLLIDRQPPDRVETILVAFGSEHFDICDTFMEYYVRHSTRSLRARPRAYLLAGSCSP